MMEYHLPDIHGFLRLHSQTKVNPVIANVKSSPETGTVAPAMLCQGTHKVSMSSTSPKSASMLLRSSDSIRYTSAMSCYQGCWMAWEWGCWEYDSQPVDHSRKFPTFSIAQVSYVASIEKRMSLKRWNTWVWVNTYRYNFSGLFTSINPSYLRGSLGTRVLTHPHISI